MKPRFFVTRSICAFTYFMCLCLAVPAAHALTLFHEWSHRVGNTSPDAGYAVAVDASGNVFVTGVFAGTVNFGGSNLVSAGDPDIFLVKYNSDGVHQWSKRFGDTGLDQALSVAADASGNVFITGAYNNSVDFGGGLQFGGVDDAFVAKYNAAGVYQWSKRLGGGGGSELGESVTVDASGNVFVVGFFTTTGNFGGSDLVSAGSSDVFVAKYNAAGVHQWSQRFGSLSGDVGTSVAVDASGNVFVGGRFGGTVNFGGANLVSAGGQDIVVAKYNAAGVHQWSQRFGSTLFDQPFSLAVDASGNVFVTGLFAGTVNFGGGNLVSAGGSDVFVAKYNAAGVHQWSQRFGSTGGDQGSTVAVGASGNIWVTGSFAGTVNFGGSNLVSAGSLDMFVAKYDATGVHQWSQRFGGSTGDDFGHVAVDALGNVLLAGEFTGIVNFGGGNLESFGFNDIFVAKYAPHLVEPLISSITDIANDQGRRVRIAFSRSGHDALATSTPVTKYEAYRRNDVLPYAASRQPAGISRESLMAAGWVFASEIPAHGDDEYLMDAPTDADSTIAQGQHYSVFFIRATTADVLTFFDSPPDSGYSKDNLAPGVPSGFAYTAGNLSWDESAAEDFDYFTVYGSNTNSFASATVVDYSIGTTMDVTASPYAYYYITATDFSGNEGKPAKVNTLTGVGETPKSYVLSVSNYPNPFNPRTTVGYTVPSHGAVTVAIYDARGAHVATLFSGERAAGTYSVEWDGRTDNAAVAASGVYFARIEHSSGTRTKKMVLLK